MALQSALFLKPGDHVVAQAHRGWRASVCGRPHRSHCFVTVCARCMLLVCRLPLLDRLAGKDSDSDEEDEEELPAYEYRFETAKLLLEVDDTVDTTLKVCASKRGSSVKHATGEGAGGCVVFTGCMVATPSWLFNLTDRTEGMAGSFRRSCFCVRIRLGSIS